MNDEPIKITALSPLPDDELFQKSIEWWQKILTLSFGIDVAEIPYRKRPLKRTHNPIRTARDERQLT